MRWRTGFPAAIVFGTLLASSLMLFPADQKQPQDTYVLPVSLGAVKFNHKAHAQERRIKCATCHHASKPQKPYPTGVKQEACGDCHTSVAKPPMKTKLQAAFHNPTATKGTCIDCHKASNAKGKKAPTKCTECHKKSNA